MPRSVSDKPMATSRPGPERIRASLDAMCEVIDERAGVRERFITPSIGGDRTVGVLATPLGEMQTMGWVICHSFGMEQVNLQTHEVPAARALAASGFPVIRYHGQGYGDSNGRPASVGLRSHLRDAVDAAGVLIAETGVRRLAFLGARVGGTVAALAARQSGADTLVLWEPVVHGPPYVRTLLRLAVMLQLMHGEREDEVARDPEAVMREQGFLDVQGYPLTAETFDELSSLDLVERVGGFRCRCLVVQVSRSTGERADLLDLVHALRQGGDADLVTIIDEKANAFGEPRFKPMGDGEKIDTQEEIGAALVANTVRWATTLDRAPEGSVA